MNCGLRIVDCELKKQTNSLSMKDKSDELKKRTKQFALRIIKLYRNLPPGKDSNVIGYQLLRCGTSVGANYRSACRGRSQADFISKITIVEEEADESAYWL